MNLRKKLFTIFGALALLALADAGMTLLSISQWQSTEQELQDHYQRSLFLQRVRAATFRAASEVSDSLLENNLDGLEEFETAIASVEEDFEIWASLAETDAEKAEVKEIRKAYDTLLQQAHTLFELLEAGRGTEAVQLAKGQIMKQDFLHFESLTEQAVASDRNERLVVQDSAQTTRQTAQLVLTIASFGILSLMLLLAAYLASDLFAPLKETRQALEDVARGDLQRRLDEGRRDEIGEIHRAFNRMLEAIAKREQVMGKAAMGQALDDGERADWEDTPSRLTLHILVSQLRSRVTELCQAEQTDENRASTGEQENDLMVQLDALADAIGRVADFSFPLDLNLAQTNMHALLYDVFSRFHEEFVSRHISYELQIAPDVGDALVDRLKLRAAFGELMRNALVALPEQGGRVGIRASRIEGGDDILIEVADDGTGMQPSLINRAFDTHGSEETYRAFEGLKLSQAIIEQHGGQFTVKRESDHGTLVQVQLPLRV